MPAEIHLDTNFLIYYIGGGDDAVVRKVEGWLTEGRAIYASAMAWAEFQCGPLTPQEHSVALDLIHSVLPVTVETATEAGRIFQETGRRSRSLADCIIAATAIRNSARLATSNRADFEPFLQHGLKLV
ncbi:MAG: PIN domain-containing protein [Methylacidiphilales bacterium]|nr:PIN domain-containing protein [Candidatus Methylacidiphilales bacterium]